MRILLIALALASLPILGLGQSEVSILPEGNDETPETFELRWQAEAGVRYEPRYSTDLSTWTTVDGYPAVATETGVAGPIPFELVDGRLFFKVLRWEGADAVAPSNPGSFAAVGGDGSATLTWTDAADADVAWYEVTWSPGGGAASIVPAGAEGFAATGLYAATNYSFTIQTVDTSGNRSTGATASATTNALPPLAISVTPTRVAMSQFESLVLTATVDPMPNVPLRFEWGTTGMYGTLNGDSSSPSEYVDDDVTDGTSEVTYAATIPGGIENIYVAVYLASEPDVSANDLVEGEARIEVSGPKQIAIPAVYELTTPGTIEGRMSTEFITAEIIEAIPAVVTYVFKLEKQPGEGWNYGPVGVTFSHRKGTSLWDSAYLTQQIGSDVFGLGETHLALVGRGGGSFNYNPNDPDDIATLEAQRAHWNQRLSAEWSVTPNTFWDRWDE